MALFAVFLTLSNAKFGVEWERARELNLSTATDPPFIKTWKAIRSATAGLSATPITKPQATHHEKSAIPWIS